MLKGFLKIIKLTAVEYKMQFDVLRIHGLCLPLGSCVYHPQYIKIGKNFKMGRSCELYCQDPQKGSELSLGDNVSLNSHVTINADCGGKIRIGNNVLIGPATVIRAANHRFDNPDIPIREQGHVGGSIVIEDDVWLGAGVTVLPNVTIGRSSVVGAGSIVTHDIAAYSVAVGSPAKVVRSRR